VAQNEGKPNRTSKGGAGANRTGGSAASGKSSSGNGTSGAGGKRSGGSKAPAGKPVARQSVAAARKSSGGSNRTQLIIGLIAIAVIAVIVVVGIVITKQQSEVQAEGYGPSTKSVATADANGVVTVTAADATPSVTIDVFEDPLCPICTEFETQFGQQINQAVDEGSLAVNYHTLNFLNPSSFSGTYSTRAAGALLCVAQQAGSQPGLYMDFHSALFDPANQPAEKGTSDLSNEQLADLATTAGAPAAATECITSGQNDSAAVASAESSTTVLSTATNGRVATPTVLHNGAPVAQLTVDWLSTLLAQG
jgi:protein-disulfide isomerase